MRKITEVVAAVIFKDGRFLICQRPANKARGLLWEFAGGKVEAGESKEEALIRECREELGVTLKELKPFTQAVHRYPDITIRLTAFTAEIGEGEPQLSEHAAMKWIYPSEAREYDFCAADVFIVKKIFADFSDRGARNKKLGKKGEKAAAKYLKRKGFKILCRNLKTPFAEVDIVAERGDVLVFCEVKTRTGVDYGTPSEAVDARRTARYKRAAEFYLKRFKEEHIIRFDVIEVLGGKINHIENAF